MIDGLIKMMKTEGVTGPINLGNPEETPIIELAELVLKLTKSRSRLSFKPLPPDDPGRRCPDITLARKLLGWQPRVSLEEGLALTIEYFKNKLGCK
jgi:UDP-glucuronate decarboxylase